MNNIKEEKLSVEETKIVWNTRLAKTIKDKGYTQTSFAKALSTDDYEVKQSMVSRWMSVGKMEKNGVIGFPTFENMKRIANNLDVDLGYLIGETDAIEFDVDEISKRTQLNPKTIVKIKKINNLNLLGNSISGEHDYRNILEMIILDSSFKELLQSIFRYKNIKERIKDEPNLIDNFKDSNNLTDDKLEFIYEISQITDYEEERYIKNKYGITEFNPRELELAKEFGEIFDELYGWHLMNDNKNKMYEVVMNMYKYKLINLFLEIVDEIEIKSE